MNRIRKQKRSVEPGAVRRLTSRQVRARYGDMSDMALWRWSNDVEMAFPKPLVINRRKFWDAAALDEWDAQQAANQAAEQ